MSVEFGSAESKPAHAFSFSVQTTEAPVSLSLSPAVLNLSTGDADKNVTATGDPDTVTFSPAFTVGSSTRPNSTCLATPEFAGVSGSGGLEAGVTAAPAGCGSILEAVCARFGSAVSNPINIVVPPQIMIKMARGEAGGLADIVQHSVLVAARNRFGDSAFPGGSAATWQEVVIPSQFYGASNPLADGPEPELSNAAEVYTGEVADIVGGSKCFWSPTNDQWDVVQAALQSGTTEWPAGTGTPICWSEDVRQIVYKASMPLNTTGGREYSEAPAFVFVRERSSSEPVAVEIP